MLFFFLCVFLWSLTYAIAGDRSRLTGSASGPKISKFWLRIAPTPYDSVQQFLAVPAAHSHGRAVSQPSHKTV